MTKATIHKTPSQELIASVSDETTVKDANGRVITLKKPGVLAQFKLVEVLGDTSSNQVYMGMVMPLIFVSAIDGDPVQTPRSKLQVEALIQRLDEAGIMAVQTKVREHYGQSTPEADKEALKN